jgi:hypothetical protein
MPLHDYMERRSSSRWASADTGSDDAPTWSWATPTSAAAAGRPRPSQCQHHGRRRGRVFDPGRPAGLGAGPASGPSVMTPRSYAMMFADHAPENTPPERGRHRRDWGYGIFVNSIGQRVSPSFMDRQIYHTGSWSGFRNLITYQPDEDVTVIVLSNNYHQRDAGLPDRRTGHGRGSGAGIPEDGVAGPRGDAVARTGRVGGLSRPGRRPPRAVSCPGEPAPRSSRRRPTAGLRG